MLIFKRSFSTKSICTCVTSEARVSLRRLICLFMTHLLLLVHFLSEGQVSSEDWLSLLTHLLLLVHFISGGQVNLRRLIVSYDLFVAFCSFSLWRLSKPPKTDLSLMAHLFLLVHFLCGGWVSLRRPICLSGRICCFRHIFSLKVKWVSEDWFVSYDSVVACGSFSLWRSRELRRLICLFWLISCLWLIFSLVRHVSLVSSFVSHDSFVVFESFVFVTHLSLLTHLSLVTYFSLMAPLSLLTLVCCLLFPPILW
jgi:hypothetical protein